MQNTEDSKLNICPSAEFCGGCIYQGRSYQDQLKEKAGSVRGFLKEAGLDPELLSGIEACPNPVGYRDRMDWTFGDEVKGGPLMLGLHRKKSFMSIIDCSECQIVPDDFNTIMNGTLQFCREKAYSHHNRKTHTGLLRNLVVRHGVRTNELLVNIVTSSDGVFDDEGYVNYILSLNLENKVVGILRTICDSLADIVACDELKVLYGNPYYMDEILGLKFKVGAFSFFQTNVQAAERLYKQALELIPGIEGKTVYDLYCGTGTISQLMALKAKQVIGVEIVEEAVEAARINAGINGLTNCRFIAGDVLNVLSDIPEKPDMIVVDPPRSGIHPKALKQICSYDIPEILYISCNPKTMTQNVAAMAEYGYMPGPIKAYDNFPLTRHVETVVLMSRDKE